MNAITEPEHYAGQIECIDAIRAALGDDAFIAYCRANALKYVWRAGRKGPALGDIQKARVYLLFAQNTILGDATKADIEYETPHKTCEDCNAQAAAIIAELEAQREATRRTIQTLQAKIDRQRSQLRSRGEYLALISDIQAWQRKTFPDATPADYLAKLHEEIAELEESLEFACSSEELADVAICLIGLAGALKIPLAEGIKSKFEINKGRSWEQDCHGHYHHKNDILIV